jgi:hypothetical protein
LWYLNKNLTYDDILELTYYLADKDNGFVTIKLNEVSINNLVNEVFEQDLEAPPKNKLRKIIFREGSGLSTTDKLKIVGKIIGKKKKAEAPDIYEAMLNIHDSNKKITIAKIASLLNVSTRTVYRNITSEIKQEKILLNEEI